MNTNKRIEKDSLGEKEVAENLYYGIFTARVLENFQITGRKIPQLFLKNYINVKKIYAIVNKNNKKLSPNLSGAIIKSCDKILSDDKFFEENFPIEIIQSGGGTSTNMMVNEVISNVANEMVGSKKGLYSPIHPNDHVNMSQSSNDTFPGVSKITILELMEKLIKEIIETKLEFEKKSNEFKGLSKVGRTHLQDALKIDSSDEFLAYSRTLEKNIEFLNLLKPFLLELSFGATALGTKQNITDEIRRDLIDELSKTFKNNFTAPKNYFEQTSSSSDFGKISAALSNFSLDLIKILNDLRLLSSGPFAGINEISLPSVQAGSSIMPGKINPSIIEAVEMACFAVYGNSQTISIANAHAQLQLQAFMPIITFTILENTKILTNSLSTFRKKCLAGIEIRKDYVSRNLEESFVFATEYSEKLGYTKMAEIVKTAMERKISIRGLIEEEISKK